MKTQKTLLFILLLLITHPILTFGQIYAPEGLNMPGGWDGWSNPPTNPVFAGEAQSDNGLLQLVELGTTSMYQTTFEVAVDGDVTSGDYEFKFTSGPTSNYWANGWGNVSVTANTLQEYQLGGGNNSITLSDQKWYVMNWENKGYENTNAVFMEIDSEPANLLSVSHTPENPAASTPVTIQVISDIAPGPAQYVYVRYTDDEWQSSNLQEVSFTGTTGTALLDGFPINTTIEYYVFSTNVENPTQNFDLQTIRFNNNEGNNYEIVISDEFPVTFSVSDGTDPVEGAIVDINSTQLTTDAAGEATIDLENGSYPYTVSADGFIDASGEVTVNGAAVSEEVTLSQGFEVTFNVDMDNFSRDFNPATDKVYISGSPFGWPEPGTDANLELTDGNSDMVYTLTSEIAIGTHEYKYFYVPDGVGSSWDYGEWDNPENRTLDVTDGPVITEDSWDAFTIEFHVTDESDENIAGANIDISGETLVTDASGMASIELPPNDTDGYDYEVSADGYSNALGNVSLDYQDKTEDVTMLAPSSFTVTFSVSDGTDPVEGATIDINSTQLTTDAAGEATIDLDNGSYPYTVVATGFMDATGEVVVNGSDVTEEVTMSVGHLVSFNVDMADFAASSDFDPATDAVYVSGSPFGWPEPGTDATLQLTDADDDLVYTLDKEVAVGSHEYKYFYVPDGTGSSWDYGEWTGGSNRALEVSGSDVVTNDIWNAFVAEFHVINESAENIEGATVEINGESELTDAAGLASFHLSPNDWDGYDYLVSADGYSNALGNIMVPYQDVEEEVTLTEPSAFTVTFSVSDGTDPVEGATIDINSTQLTTDAAGEATIDLDNGSYPYTVVATGFMDATGEVVVNGSDVTEEVTLSMGHLVTFNMDMADFAASSDFDPATDAVYVSGSPFGWPEPGTDATLQLTDADDDLVYTLDKEVAVGSHEYKYFYVPDGTGSSWDFGEWTGEESRILEVADSDVTTDDIWNAFYVEFHVTNSADENIEGATISIDGQYLTTGVDGLAETTLAPDGVNSYAYEVNADGYATASGSVMVNYADVFEEVTLFEPNSFIVNFLVDMSPAEASGEFNPDEDAVYVSGSAFGWPEPGTDPALELIDPDGDMIYGMSEQIAVGNYEYKYFVVPGASGSSWDYGEWDGEVNRTFNVTDSDLSLNDYWGNFEVEFHVTNTEGGNVQGATISINGEELTTNIGGVATTIAPPNNSDGYDYEVSADGYANAFGNILVDYEDVVEEVTLTEPASYQVTFEVSDGTTPVEGAVIDINDMELTTDASGIATIELPNGNYPYSVTSDDFLTYEGTVIVNGEDLTEEVILLTGYLLTFNVDMTPAVESTDFDPATDAVFVSGSLFGWPEPGTAAGLELVDPDGDLIYSLDTIGEIGTHEYKYFYVPGGTGSSWDYGEWQGEINRSLEVSDSNIELNDIWANFTVEFHVTNEADLDIAGATITINGEELTTDSEGIASTYLPPNADEGYDYEVAANGYLPGTGNILVDYTDVQEEVMLEAENTYSVTFIVSDGENPVEGAAIMLDGYGEQMTDASGETIYNDVSPSDSIYFSVATDDYLFYEDSVAVDNQNVTEYVTLVPVSNTNEAFTNLSVYPNPVKEVLFVESDLTDATLQIFSTNGRLIKSKSLTGDVTISFAGQPAGVYILRLIDGENVKTLRVIKGKGR